MKIFEILYLNEKSGVYEICCMNNHQPCTSFFIVNITIKSLVKIFTTIYCTLFFSLSQKCFFCKLYRYIMVYYYGEIYENLLYFITLYLHQIVTEFGVYVIKCMSKSLIYIFDYDLILKLVPIKKNHSF